MIRIEANCLYSRDDLRTMLEPCGVDVDHFIGRLRPRKVFKMVWLGEDILTALRAAPALADRVDAPSLPAPANKGNRTRRGKAPAVGNRPGDKIDAYVRTLKRNQ